MMLRHRAGITFNKRFSGGDTPADDGWNGSFQLIGNSNITIAAVTDGKDYVVNAAAAITANYAPGYYSWVFTVTKGSDTYQLQEGSIEILPSISVTGDQRSHVRKMADAIEATLEGRASADVLEYEIAGRRLKKIPLTELIRLHNRYKAMLKQEENAQKIANGELTSRDIRVRF